MTTEDQAASPIVITPDYDDAPITAQSPEPSVSDKAARDTTANAAAARSRPAATRRSPEQGRNPFHAYGERSSSHPYALRLPDAIDLVLRQMAAEERTHPLRIIDRILFDHLKRIGRLPPTRGA